MAAYTPFKRDDPVLFFKLRAHVRDAPREQRRYLLWPVWTYRVVAPTAEQRRLNILQKAVLGLCNAGVFEIKRVAERLDIHAALAKEIILTLQQDGLANSRGLPTDAGMKTLIDETIKISDSVSVGHVFQDPWTGELWPRFVQDLNYAELRYEDSDHPRLVLGSTGKPRYQWAYQYAPRGDTPTRPQPKQIIDAVRQHKRAKRHSVEWEYDEDNYVSYADKELQDRLERVSIVDDAPQRMFLATYLYLDEAEADWYVCDPFGFGPSLFLRRRIDEQIKEPWAGGLREQVQGILKNSLHGSLEDIEQWHEKLRYQATLQVRHKVPYLNDKAIFKALLDVEFACQKIKDMEYFEQDMRNIFREGRRALEGIFHHLIMAYKQGDEWSILPGKDIQACKKVYIEVAEKIGLNVENHSLNLSKDNAKNAIKKGKSQGLWSLIIACLLVAHQNDRHPMHLAAKKNPNLLTDIKELSAQGNDASHYNAKTEAEPNVIRGYVEKIYAVAALFFVQEHSAAHTGENHG